MTSATPLRTSVLLPLENRSPATARRVVDKALRDTGLDHLADEALLLVTELVTNGIVHGGTEVGLDVLVDDEGLTVEVSDRSPGRLAVHDAPGETWEGGRGIFLLDALATAWGTRHTREGKSVWFRLGPSPEPVRPVTAAPPGSPRRDLSFLLGLPADLETRLGPSRVVAELLRRLVDGLELDGGWVVAPASTDAPWAVHSGLGEGPGPDPELVRRGLAPGFRALPMSGRDGPVGALVLPPGPLGEDDLALARLVAERLSVVLRDEQAQAAYLRTRGSLALLAEASELFAGTLDVTLTATLAAQLVVPRLAHWSAVWTTYEYAPVLEAVAHASESGVDELRAALLGNGGRALVAAVAGRGPGERVILLSPAEIPGGLDAGAGAGEVLVLPLVAKGRALGLLATGRPPGRGYAPDDAGLLADLARVAALALDNARLYEERSSVARALQDSLLPPEMPLADGLQFGARYVAAGEGVEVGGDFYDVFEVGEAGWGITVGDVCGKGASAAAITGIAREVLRLLSRDGTDPTSALRRLNETLLALGDRGRFCTAVLGTVRRADGGFVVRFSSAGHPPPVHLTANGEARFVGTSGTLLGVLPDIDLADDQILLAPGDSLVFYTDGVTERRGRTTMFGDENLLDALRAASGRSAADMADLLERAAQRFDAGAVAARDDLAVFVVKATSLAGPDGGRSAGPAP